MAVETSFAALGKKKARQQATIVDVTKCGHKDDLYLMVS